MWPCETEPIPFSLIPAKKIPWNSFQLYILEAKINYKLSVKFYIPYRLSGVNDVL